MEETGKIRLNSERRYSQNCIVVKGWCSDVGRFLFPPSFFKILPNYKRMIYQTSPQKLLGIIVYLLWQVDST